MSFMGTTRHWPFPIHVQPTSPSGAWTVACHMPGADMSLAGSRLSLACELFLALARQGAFRGAGDAPGAPSQVARATRSEVIIEREMVIVQSAWAPFDALALGVLANLVERLLPEAAQLSISVPIDTIALRPEPGIYPPTLHEAPFPVHDDSSDGNLEVLIEFASALEPAQRTQVEDVLSDWWCASVLGAFREADQTVLESSALPPQAVEWVDRTLAFTVEKLRASAAVVDALVGLVIWVDRFITPVTALDIA